MYLIFYSVLDVDSWDDGSLTFDLVACLNLLDRCDKPLSILHSIKKVLKPGGRVIVAAVLPFKPYVEFGNLHLYLQYIVGNIYAF
jgi:2-polyprenyl-3-methyl-5-hydroxy-6-metoxy-1,4-benzoquinol methylase